MDDQGNYLYKTSTIGEPGEPYLKSNSGVIRQSVWSLQGLDYSRQFGGHDVGATLVYHERNKKVKDGGLKKIFFLAVSKGMAGRLTYSFGQRYLPLVIMARRISEAGIVSDSSCDCPRMDYF